LNQRSRGINVKVRVVEKSEPRTVFSRRDNTEHRVTEALVGDETGSIQLTLWDDAIDEIVVDDVISIKNGYINTFRGSMRLNIGRYGTSEKIEEEIPTVNSENNLSERQVPQRYGSDRRRRSYRRY
jgi:replication factor A1